MRSFWSDPYLWIHLAGLAALPIWLELCFLGLAVGDPIFPVWLELAFVSISGIVPILWMQWQRPFYIFSLLAIALKPEKLTLPQRQLLTRFKSTQNQFLAVAVAILLAVILRQLYVFAPIATPVVPFSIESRGLGLLWAAIAFLGCNLFLQVPVSVASVMLTSDAAFASTEPYPAEQIAPDFTRLGLPVSQLLPEVSPKEAATRTSATDRSIAPSVISSPVAQAQPTLLEKQSSDDTSLDIEADLPETEPPETTPLEAVQLGLEESSLAGVDDTEASLPKLSTSESIGTEAEVIASPEIASREIASPEIASPEINTVEVNGIAVEESIGVEAIAASIESGGEAIDLLETNAPTTGDEVEQSSSEQATAIARIDQQSVSEGSSMEESECPELDSP